MTVFPGRQFSVLATELMFDEEQNPTSMIEDTATYEVTGDLNGVISTSVGSVGWEFKCNDEAAGGYLAGEYQAPVSPDYDLGSIDRLNVSGVIGYDVTSGGEIVEWHAKCLYVTEGAVGANETLAAVPHTPVLASPTLRVGFEIVDDDTLIIQIPDVSISGIQRVYVYDRIQ